MKQTKATCVALAFAMMASSCGSAYQAESGVRGAMIGGWIIVWTRAFPWRKRRFRKSHRNGHWGDTRCKCRITD